MGLLGDAWKAAKSLDKGINDAINASTERNFGTRLSNDKTALLHAYKALYFYFGLNSPYRLPPGSMIPMEVRTGWGTTTTSFKIRGTIHSPNYFIAHGYDNVFNIVSREIPAGRGRGWAFDITNLWDGILNGEVVDTDDSRFIQSEEYLTVLRIIGGGSHKPLNRVPSVELEFGYMWQTFGIPDRIHFVMSSMYPFTDDDMMRIVHLLSHHYQINNAPVNFGYSGNPAEGRMTVTTTPREAAQHGGVPPRPEQAPQSAPAQESAGPGNYSNVDDFMRDLSNLVDEHERNQKTTAPDDGFPYEFYRGLGLIDENDQVHIPAEGAFSGWVRYPHHMTEHASKEFLLNYKPEA